MNSERGWTLRPRRADLILYARWAIFLDVLFIVVYGGCNWITSQRADLLGMYFEWELGIPFVPWTVWVYLSLYATFPLPAFALRRPELDILGKRLALATVIAGVLFLLLPGRLGFERPAGVPGHDGAFGFIYFLDLPHNLVPSLHVAWGALILYPLHGVSPAWAKRMFELWFVSLCASVVLVHQHHLLDVAGGLLLAYLSATLVEYQGRLKTEGSST